MRTVILLGLGVWTISAGLLAPTSAASEPEIDANVAFVSTGGAWSHGDQSGFIRVVVVNGGFEHVTSRLFLQWLAASAQKGVWIVESMSVESINQPGVWSLGQPEIGHENDVTVVHLHGTNPYDGEHALFTLPVKEPGNFEVQRIAAQP